MRATSLKLGTLRDLFVEELRDLYNAEKQLTEALPKMSKAANAAELKAAFDNHLRQTQEHVSRLESVFSHLGQKPTGKTCEAMKGLIKEGENFVGANGDQDVRDAGLIASAQKVEHYEISGYGTMRTFAQTMGQPEVAQLLDQTLKEEEATDKKLTQIAKSLYKEAQRAERSMGQENGSGRSQSGGSSSRSASNARSARSAPAEVEEMENEEVEA